MSITVNRDDRGERTWGISYIINLKSIEKRYFLKMNRTSTRMTIDKINNRKQLALAMR